MNTAAQHVVTVLAGLVAIALLVCLAMLGRVIRRERHRWAGRFGTLVDRVVDKGLKIVVAAVLLVALALFLRAAAEQLALFVSWLAVLALLSAIVPWVTAVHRSVVYLAALAIAYAMTLHRLLPPGSEGPQAMGAFLIMGFNLMIVGLSLALRLIVAFCRTLRSASRRAPVATAR